MLEFMTFMLFKIIYSINYQFPQLFQFICIYIFKNYSLSPFISLHLLQALHSQHKHFPRNSCRNTLIYFDEFCITHPLHLSKKLKL